jgi:hypothetical protein
MSKLRDIAKTVDGGFTGYLYQLNAWKIRSDDLPAGVDSERGPAQTFEPDHADRNSEFVSTRK